jgi:murein DD-endopeptidase MepM/ murein hydrolase activator NlpD
VRRTRTGAAFGALLIAAACAALPAWPRAALAGDEPGVVAVLPVAPVQGDTIAITLSAAGASGVAVRFDGRAVAVYARPGGGLRALVGTDPTTPAGRHRVAVSWREPGRGGLRWAGVVPLGPGRFGVRALTLPPKVFGLITPHNAALERAALGAALGRRTPEALWRGPFVAPSRGILDSPYGWQSVYNGRREWWHQGMDYAAPEGDPVVAANTGVVVLARLLPLGGNTVVLDHGQGVLSEYIHLSGVDVAPGQRVARGEPIGRIGATGLVTGPSLHWGLFVNGTWVNPVFWMAPRAGLTQ